MTAEEALKIWLPIVKDGVKNMPEIAEAFDMAFKALEGSRWILPVERLPEDEAGTYWVCTDSGYQCQCRWTNANPICTYMTTDWHWSIFDVPQYSKVIAWRELPEPYRAESEEV